LWRRHFFVKRNVVDLRPRTTQKKLGVDCNAICCGNHEEIFEDGADGDDEALNTRMAESDLIDLAYGIKNNIADYNLSNMRFFVACVVV
jgi:hypothetical protein